MYRCISGYGINPLQIDNIRLNLITRGEKSYFEVKGLFKLNTFDLSLVATLKTSQDSANFREP